VRQADGTGVFYTAFLPGVGAPMSKWLDWLVEHEKYLGAIVLALVVALAVQLKFCKRPVAPDNDVARSKVASQAEKSVPGSSTDLSGTWEMTVPKKRGEAQVWTLKLKQKGEQLRGVLTSEGGDLDISGSIRGQNVDLSAKRFGITVEFPAVLDGDILTGEMRALSVRLKWTAKRTG
jgi:hypothetical protein